MTIISSNIILMSFYLLTPSDSHYVCGGALNGIPHIWGSVHFYLCFFLTQWISSGNSFSSVLNLSLPCQICCGELLVSFLLWWCTFQLQNFYLALFNNFCLLTVSTKWGIILTLSLTSLDIVSFNFSYTFKIDNLNFFSNRFNVQYSSWATFINFFSPVYESPFLVSLPLLYFLNWKLNILDTNM